MLVLIVLGISIPIILAFNEFTFEKFVSQINENLGDTIGGVTSPFVGLLGSYLVYLGFKAQIDANKQVNDGLLDQQKINQLEKNIQFIIDEINNFRCLDLNQGIRKTGNDALEYIFSNIEHLEKIQVNDLRSIYLIIISLESLDKKFESFKSESIEYYKNIISIKYHNSISRFLPSIDELKKIKADLILFNNNLPETMNLKLTTEENNIILENSKVMIQMIESHIKLFEKLDSL